MRGAAEGLLAAWRQALPRRWRGLVVPYGQAIGTFVAGYVGATVLIRPWALGGWWSCFAPLAAGLGVCWWLWRPWALLATNSKGESRRLPLMLVWLLCMGLGLSLRAGLYDRLGQVRDLASVHDLAEPGSAIFFRLRGPFYPAKALRGHHESFYISTERGGRKRFFSTCDIACPLLAAAADTARHHAAPLAWLSYTYEEHLGDNLAPAEREWQRENFVARCEAQFDTLDLRRFSYLQRPEHPTEGAYQATYAARLPAYPDPPLLLEPVHTSFARRGLRPLYFAGSLLLGGSALVVGLLLTMPLRLGGEEYHGGAEPLYKM
jgi:hypothetical protein